MLFAFLFIGFLVMLLLVVYFSFELKNEKAKHLAAEKENQRKLFELSVLSEISDKIGYSLSSKDIASTIAATSVKLFPVSAVTYATIENDHIEIITVAHERVGSKHITGAKDILVTGIYAIDESLKTRSISHKIGGIPAVDLGPTDIPPVSYFNVPLVLNNRFTGMITITSNTPHAYQEEDMSMLYKIVNRAQLALSRLEGVVDEEKGKVEALVKSLSSGEMFFTLRFDSLQLFTINPAALRFLGIAQENPDIIQVLSKFTLKPNIISELKSVILQKKSTIYRDVLINDARFNIYLTPVFSLDYKAIIGVAMTMQDVTREHEIQKMKEGFTNMMVHELRAPLTAIKGAADLLLKPETDEEDKIRMRLIIKNSSERLLGEVDDMLDSARIDAGKLLVYKQQGNINDVIVKTIEELSYTAQSKAILIENHLSRDIPPFDFDPVRIGQVMTNLISNAIKYSDANTMITVSSKYEHGWVEVEVKDQGIGIEEGKLESLFQPFAQGNFLHKAKGTGLGLYITKTIVTEHDGKIWVESRKGEGTTMKFRLPTESKEEKLPKSMAN